VSGRWIAAVVVAAACVVAVGFWETRHFERSEGGHMRDLWTQVAGLQPSGYRIAAPFDCLDYRMAKNPFAIEVCFDARGRLIEAVDRRDLSDTRLWSLRFDAGAAPLTIPPPQLIKRFQRMGVLREYGDASYLPSPHADLGPLLAPERKSRR
jgi:hypothetical protein